MILVAEIANESISTAKTFLAPKASAANPKTPLPQPRSATLRPLGGFLSKASKHSLKLQGGPMKAKEIEEFEKNPNLNAIIQVRYIDDEGKDPKMETFPFSYFAPLIEENINK